MSRVAVIFDTNSCHVDRKLQFFFGYRDILKDISTRATILMPKIVIDELIQQNTEGTRENIANLRDNSLLPLLGFDANILDSLVENEHAEKLYLGEDIVHEVIDIIDIKKAFEKIRNWSIAGRAPFNKRNDDGKNNSDKGIKDAIIACTIDEILELGSYNRYYLACNDGRLKEYYKDNSGIICLTPQEILNELKKEFFDAYTVDIIRNVLDQPHAELKDNWLNINGDVVGSFGYEEYTTFVVLDIISKEMLKISDVLFVPDVKKLTSSGSYASTHALVTEITDNIDYYRPPQLEEIKDTLIENSQIYSIGMDEDVKTLAAAIFKYFYNDFKEYEKKHFNVYYELRESE